jgi:hypothetical protein
MPNIITATEYGFDEVICTKNGNFEQHGLEEFYNSTDDRCLLVREFYGVKKRKLKIEDCHIDYMLESVLGEAPEDAEFDNVEELYAFIHEWNTRQQTWTLWDEDRDTVVTVSDAELAELTDMSLEELHKLVMITTVLEELHKRIAEVKRAGLATDTPSAAAGN